MIGWDNFIIFAAVSVILWITGAICAWKGKRPSAIAFTACGIAVFAIFIAGLWISLHRPPMRTLGETRLWYAVFMVVAALATYARWEYKWILFFSAIMGTVFSAINIFMPQIHDQTLMPALQSGWFIPHVTVYMFSYSLMGCAFIIAIAGCIQNTGKYLETADSLVYAGTAFLTFGMLSGALWAKQAWGIYWNWDPKETWAAITWGIYLLYMHARIYERNRHAVASILLILGFICLQMCWWGVNLLPAAQESMHVYGQ